MVLDGTDISIVNGTPNQTIFVLAITYRRYEEWCRAHELNPRSPSVLYIRGPETLRGYVNCWYKDLGTDFNNAHEIYDVLELYKNARGFREIPC
jgi:hypothetical protein